MRTSKHVEKPKTDMGEPGTNTLHERGSAKNESPQHETRAERKSRVKQPTKAQKRRATETRAHKKESGKKRRRAINNRRGRDLIEV